MTRAPGRGARAALLGALLTLTACAPAADAPAPVEVRVELDVCQGADCVVVGVPGAAVTLTQADEPVTATTDADGRATLPATGAGAADVTASWGEASSTAHVEVGDPVSVTLRLPGPADLPAP